LVAVDSTAFRKTYAGRIARRGVADRAASGVAAGNRAGAGNRAATTGELDVSPARRLGRGGAQWSGSLARRSLAWWQLVVAGAAVAAAVAAVWLTLEARMVSTRRWAAR
jgi:hypothetical protein